MINLEKVNRKSATPLPLLETPAPAPNFHAFFLIFQIPHPVELIKIYFHPFKGRGANYVI